MVNTCKEVKVARSGGHNFNIILVYIGYPGLETLYKGNLQICKLTGKSNVQDLKSNYLAHGVTMTSEIFLCDHCVLFSSHISKHIYIPQMVFYFNSDLSKVNLNFNTRLLLTILQLPTIFHLNLISGNGLKL